MSGFQPKCGLSHSVNGYWRNTNGTIEIVSQPFGITPLALHFDNKGRNLVHASVVLGRSKGGTIYVLQKWAIGQASMRVTTLQDSYGDEVEFYQRN